MRSSLCNTGSGYTPTVANTPDDTKDSDANVTTGKSQVVTLTSEGE